jgi:N-acetylglucosamine kinase-like BadF-type ATPase
MNQSEYIVGVDGGGTKTRAVIAKMDGVILAEHIGGPSNMQVLGIEKTVLTILQLIRECCESAACDFSQLAAVGCGLAGVGRAADQQRMEQGLREYAALQHITFNRIIIVSDARIAVEGAFKGGPGIILIAGTGSIAFGKNAQGEIHRVGGWGRYLDDEGSGYFIGKSALAAVGHYLDGFGPKTTLVEDVSSTFGLKDQAAIIDAVYKNNFDIASIAPLVMQGAEKEDKICRGIVDRAIVALSNYVRALSKRMNPSSETSNVEPLRLVFVGGLIAHDTILARSLKQYIEKNISLVTVVPAMGSPAQGAVLLTLNSIR